MVKGRECYCYYYQFREGPRVRSRYVESTDIEGVQRALERRRENESAPREQARNRA